MRSIALFLVLSLSACGSEPDFDERYGEAEQEIRNKADDLERDLGEESEPDTASRESQVEED